MSDCVFSEKRPTNPLVLWVYINNSEAIRHAPRELRFDFPLINDSDQGQLWFMVHSLDVDVSVEIRIVKLHISMWSGR